MKSILNNRGMNRKKGKHGDYLLGVFQEPACLLWRALTKGSQAEREAAGPVRAEGVTGEDRCEQRLQEGLEGVLPHAAS